MMKGWNGVVRPIAGFLVALTAACGSASSGFYGGGARVSAGAVPPEAAPARDESLAMGSPSGDEERASGGEDAAKAPPAPPKQAESQPPPSTTPTTGSGTPPPTAVGQDRRSPILIYKADFTMSVYEVEKAIDAVQGLAEKNGGYLARRDNTSITIRVPAGSFQGIVVELTKLGDVLKRDVVSEDVTAEYRDLEVQLQNQLAMRDRFQKLLEKAQKVDEALQIERELGRVTQEIERIKGRLKLLNDLASYSTITVRFSPRVDQQIQGGPFVLPLPWLNNLGLPRLLSL